MSAVTNSSHSPSATSTQQLKEQTPCLTTDLIHDQLLKGSISNPGCDQGRTSAGMNETSTLIARRRLLKALPTLKLPPLALLPPVNHDSLVPCFGSARIQLRAPRRLEPLRSTRAEADVNAHSSIPQQSVDSQFRLLAPGSTVQEAVDYSSPARSVGTTAVEMTQTPVRRIRPLRLLALPPLAQPPRNSQPQMPGFCDNCDG